MILDARTTGHAAEGTRPYTAKAAVENMLSGMAVGDTVTVDRFISWAGDDLKIDRLAMYVSRLANGRRFTVRQSKGAVATVTRLA